MANNNSNRDRSPESAAPSVVFGKDAKAIGDSIRGFINRNQNLTERTLVPQQIPAVGADFMKRVRQSSAYAQAWNNYFVTTPFGTRATAAMKTGAAEAVPGIMTLWFTPVLSDSNEDEVSMTHISYLAKWMNEMVASNNTKNWQPGDQQFIDVAVGCLKMYLATATRAILIMRDATTNISANNTYLNAVALLKSMGFEFTADEISDKFTSIWRYFNNNLLNVVNHNRWLKYSYPGMNRWASLCEALYRDTPAKTDYAQLYMFMPQYMIELSDEFDVEQQKIGWNIGFKRNIYKEPINFRDLYAFNSVPIGQRGYQQFMAFLKDVEAIIKFIFYNDDTRTIMATLQQIDIRNYTTPLSESAPFNFEILAFSDDHASEDPLPIIYDSAMLLAIHNATIQPNVYVSDAYVTPASGNLAQTVYMNVSHNDYLAEHGYGPMALHARGGVIQAFNPKVMNFPSFYPTMSDYINATQWTFSLAGTLPPNTDSYDPAKPFGSKVTVAERKKSKSEEKRLAADDVVEKAMLAALPENAIILPSTCVGTDFISECTITYMAPDGNFDTALSLKSDLTEPQTFDIIRYTGIYASTYASPAEMEQYNRYWGQSQGNAGPDIEKALNEALTAYQFAQQFALAPIAQSYALGRDENTDWYWQYRGPVTQSDVYYVVDGRYLSMMHAQWRANFWGYPVVVQGGEGSPELTNTDAAAGKGGDPLSF